MSAPLNWECCPFCKEVSDTERVGKPLEITSQDGKLHVHVNKLKRCNSCGKTWRSELPTMVEAFGRDQEDDTPF
jgi:hypothetical protein